MTARRLSIFLALLLFSVITARAQDLVENAFRIPIKDAGKKGLEAVMVRPNEPGPHPLAVLTHGTPREPGDRPGMSPWQMVPQAREFARRGWTTVVVLRRGYGDSGGGFDEDAKACSRRPDYYDSGKESAKELRESIAYLSKLPEVDPRGSSALEFLLEDSPPLLLRPIRLRGLWPRLVLLAGARRGDRTRFAMPMNSSALSTSLVKSRAYPCFGYIRRTTISLDHKSRRLFIRRSRKPAEKRHSSTLRHFGRMAADYFRLAESLSGPSWLTNS